MFFKDCIVPYTIVKNSIPIQIKSPLTCPWGKVPMRVILVLVLSPTTGRSVGIPICTYWCTYRIFNEFITAYSEVIFRVVDLRV